MKMLPNWYIANYQCYFQFYSNWWGSQWYRCSRDFASYSLGIGIAAAMGFVLTKREEQFNRKNESNELNGIGAIVHHLKLSAVCTHVRTITVNVKQMSQPVELTFGSCRIRLIAYFSSLLKCFTSNFLWTEKKSDSYFVSMRVDANANCI